MARYEFHAMGTDVAVLVPEGRERAARGIERLFEEWETRFSRFRDDSELSHVNRHAGEPVQVSELFMRVLDSAIGAARATGGIFDPTLLRQLIEAGYDRTFAAMSRDLPAAVTQPRPGGDWRAIRVEGATRTVTLPAGVLLDFGGIAKGMAVDAAVEQLAVANVSRAAVDAGGDLRVHGLPPGESSWQVAVDLPNGSHMISLASGALATSSLSRRQWTRAGQVQHHILDPRTGRPSESGLWSATVAAALCVQADVAAKTAFVLGARDGARFLEERGLPGLLVSADGTRHAVMGWPA